MELSNTSISSPLNKTTYVNLRWIGIFGQFITINSVAFLFKFEFNFLLANLVVLAGALSNIFLFYFFKKNQLVEKISLNFLILDILQLRFLIYLSVGTIIPFSIFLLFYEEKGKLLINIILRYLVSLKISEIYNYL